MKHTIVVLATAFAVTVPGAAAQAPQRTTATYDDWTVRCEDQAGPPPRKQCEIVQSTQVSGQQQPVTQIAIGRPAKGAPLKMVLLVPIGSWLPDGVKLTSADREPLVTAAFKRCLPSACLADLDLSDELARKLRTFKDNGKLEFKDGGQHDVNVPVSFKGFGPALDALPKE